MGLFKGIKKAFKKVTKVAIKVAPIALAAAAIVFTGGAALGLAPFAGGWAAAAGSFASSLGLTGTLGSIATGALTHAGFGAAIGGVGNLVMGGDPIKGAQMGALAGTVTGGFSGALSGFEAASAAAGAGTSANTAPVTAATAGGEVAPTGISSLSVGPQSASDLTLSAAQSAPSASHAIPSATGVPGAAGTGAATQTASPATGFGSFLSENKEIVGKAIAGLGQGYLQGRPGSDAQKAAQREQERRTASYNIDPAALQYAPVDPSVARPTGREAYGDGGRRARRYVYDPEARRIVQAEA